MIVRKIVVANDRLLGEVVRMLAEGQTVTIRSKGNSMLPFIIGDRDLVVLKRQSTYNKYDMVLCSLGDGHYVLHRIIKIEGERVTLMGDGNLYGTESCEVDDIAGRLIEITWQRYHGDHSTDCTTPGYLLKARLWHFLLPIRKYLLIIYRRCSISARKF